MIPDPYGTEEYSQFIQSMVPHCHCAERYRPCDGVLAGGVCDGQEDPPYAQKDPNEDEDTDDDL